MITRKSHYIFRKKLLQRHVHHQWSFFTKGYFKKKIILFSSTLKDFQTAYEGEIYMFIYCDLLGKTEKFIFAKVARYTVGDSMVYQICQNYKLKNTILTSETL